MELSSFTSLETLSLTSNQLSGTIPKQLGNLSSLYLLRISNNQLSGTIPEELGNLSSLSDFSMTNNRLIGTIPMELFNLTRLEVFGVSLNQLRGTIPKELGNLTRLRSIYLDFNQLTGTIPTELGNLTRLRELHLNHNHLTGTVGRELGNFAGAHSIRLNNNQLTGTLPRALGNLIPLVHLYLDNNQLSGTIPRELGNLRSLITLTLDTNQFSGSIDPSLLLLPLLNTLSVANNNISAISTLVPGQRSVIRILDLNSNNLVMIPTSVFSPSIFPNLAILDFGNNQISRFSGTLETYSYWSSPIQSMNLANNRFRVQDLFPTLLEYFILLRVLLVSGNLFTGRMPALAHMSALTVLDISRNALSGTVPLDTPASLRVCIISSNVGTDNNISCPLPRAPAACFATNTCSCPAGEYFLGGDCAKCQPGTISSFAATSCQPCPRGSVSNSLRTECITCAAGTVANLTDQTCSRCFRGQFAPQDGSTACQAAPPGYYVLSNAAGVAPCAPGSFLDSSTSECSPCEPGYFAGEASSACSPCPATTYGGQGSDNSCITCPPAAVSPAASASLFSCTCPAGYFPRSVNTSWFECTRCPAGATCDPARLRGLPLATEGYWHTLGSSASLYSCRSGVCLGETDAVNIYHSDSNNATSNCRPGHEGVLCGLCAPGHSLEAGFCVPCALGDALESWPQHRLSGAVVGAVLLVGIAASLYLLSPLFKPRMIALLGAARRLMGGALAKFKPVSGDGGAASSAEEAVHRARQPQSAQAGPGTLRERASQLGAALALRAQALVTSLLPFVAYLPLPIRLMTENIQIINTFKTAFIRLSWPAVHTQIFRRFDVLQLSFTEVPKAACGIPKAGFYTRFMGVTLGVTGLLAFMGALWALGAVLLRRQQGACAVTSFHRLMTSRLVLVLTLCYAPLTETILSVFNCREVNGVYYLAADVSRLCYDETHMAYLRAGIFWTVLYPAGIPLFYLALLYGFRVPALARRLLDSVKLVALVNAAHLHGIEQPEVDLLRLSPDSFTDAHLNVLYSAFIVRAPEAKAAAAAAAAAEAAADTLLSSGGDAEAPEEKYAAALPEEPPAAAVSPAVAAVPRAKKLAVLIKYSRDHFGTGGTTWLGVRGDAQLDAAREAIGNIFLEFHADCWFWILIEVFVKLLFTGVLQFVLPDSPAQVFAGLSIAFANMLLFQNARPYSDKGVRQVGFVATMLLFLFLLMAILIKGEVRISKHPSTFYAVCVGVLSCATFVAPALIIGYRLVWGDVRKLRDQLDVSGNDDDEQQPPQQLAPPPLLLQQQQQEDHHAGGGATLSIAANHSAAAAAAGVVVPPPHASSGGDYHHVVVDQEQEPPAARDSSSGEERRRNHSRKSCAAALPVAASPPHEQQQQEKQKKAKKKIIFVKKKVKKEKKELETVVIPNIV